MAQITQIASHMAPQLTDEGADPQVTREEWRHALHLATAEGDVDWLLEFLEGQDPEDEVLKAHCQELRSR
jgi:hypothetical protein